MPYVGEDVPLVNLYTILTASDAEREEITKKQRQMLIGQGTDPEESLFVQDVAEPIIEAVAPIGSFLDTWKIPIGISAAVVGSMLLLGYSGLGGSVGRVVERRIK